jgi:hypothetical protein
MAVPRELAAKALTAPNTLRISFHGPNPRQTYRDARGKPVDAAGRSSAAASAATSSQWGDEQKVSLIQVGPRLEPHDFFNAECGF